jgi:hypothetical protein
LLCCADALARSANDTSDYEQRIHSDFQFDVFFKEFAYNFFSFALLPVILLVDGRWGAKNRGYLGGFVTFLQAVWWVLIVYCNVLFFATGYVSSYTHTCAVRRR